MHAAKTLRLLLVEDSTPQAELVAEMVDDAMPGTRLTSCASLAGALAAVESSEFDAALVDLSLPDAAGLEAVDALHEAAADLPLVVLTGHDDDRTALGALNHGAQDYLYKGDLDARLLARSIHYARERQAAERAVRDSQRWSASLLDALDSPTCAVDGGGVILAVNARWRDRGEPAGLTPPRGMPGVSYERACLADDSVNPADAAAVAEGLASVLAGEADRFEHDHRHRVGGSRRWSSVRITPLPNGGAVIEHVDVTALKSAQEELREAALHDSLTGLPNRTLLLDRLEQAFARAERGEGGVAAVFLDIDRFKSVNDGLGHAAGDGVLCAVAAALTGAVRPSDTVARVSGDEFVVVRHTDGPRDAVRFAERLRAAVCRTFDVQGRRIAVTASLGLAEAAPGQTPDDLLIAADEAMYLAKAHGRGQVEVASAELREKVQQRVAIERDLATALENDRFEVHYQPVVRLATGRIIGVEALVRMRDTDGTLLTPSEFMDIAEHCGLIVPTGAWVLREACAQGKAWERAGMPLAIAVNLSTRQLAQPGVVATVGDALADSGLDPRQLILEVTESTVVEDAEVALHVIRKLKELGVRIAIDDFGTGYSSFVYLKQFPLDILKVDRSFVAGLPSNTEDRAIVASVVRLGRDLGLELVAEGVETEEQRRVLHKFGCRLGQGYLFARPVPAAEVAALVHASASGGELPEQRRRSTGTDAIPAEVTQRIIDLRRQGASPHTIAGVLNVEGAERPDGVRWHAKFVARFLETAGRR